MERVNGIIKHKLYLEYIQRIKAWEQDRIFCKHDMVHFLDVCRLAQIDWLELQLRTMEEKSYEISGNLSGAADKIIVNKELIYAAGLLHDIGRWQEYESGIRHEIAGSKLAYDILQDTGFDEKETAEIMLAISNHRNKEIKDEVSLSGFLYRADKKSRACFSCEAEGECDWSALKKNMVIK